MPSTFSTRQERFYITNAMAFFVGWVVLVAARDWTVMVIDVLAVPANPRRASFPQVPLPWHGGLLSTSLAWQVLAFVLAFVPPVLVERVVMLAIAVAAPLGFWALQRRFNAWYAASQGVAAPTSRVAARATLDKEQHGQRKQLKRGPAAAAQLPSRPAAGGGGGRLLPSHVRRSEDAGVSMHAFADEP
jgi:hypothetical protein